MNKNPFTKIFGECVRKSNETQYCEFLSRAIVENVATSWKGQTVSIVGGDMNVCDVCRSFVSYVRLQVEDSQDHTGTLNFIVTTFPILYAGGWSLSRFKMSIIIIK